jgi:23S rRNA (cytidine1920-2'-O)/16S rRNA (cytidine1409-2'-O)-methyltransferase
VLLERGATHVVAVDVGHDQMDRRLREDRRITNLEGLNARVLDADHLDERTIQAVVSDVSFISLKLAAPSALELAEAGSWCVLLVKPQFEAGRDNVGKGGMLKDPSSAPKIAEDLELWLNSLGGWQSLGVIPSPISGGDGNSEFLLAGRKS